MHGTIGLKFVPQLLHALLLECRQALPSFRQQQATHPFQHARLVAGRQNSQQSTTISHKTGLSGDLSVQHDKRQNAVQQNRIDPRPANRRTKPRHSTSKVQMMPPVSVGFDTEETSKKSQLLARWKGT